MREQRLAEEATITCSDQSSSTMSLNPSAISTPNFQMLKNINSERIAPKRQIEEEVKRDESFKVKKINSDGTKIINVVVPQVKHNKLFNK